MPYLSDDLSQKYARFPVFGGLNVYDAEDQVAEGEVTDSLNFLFEGKQARTRPGLVVPANGLPALAAGDKVLLAGSLPFFPALTASVGFVLAASGKLYKYTSDDPYNGLALATGSPGTAGYPVSYTTVNNKVLFGGQIGGAILQDWNPVTNVVAPLGTNSYGYVATLLSRALGANVISPGNITTQVGWSASGDETNWTTADSGNQNLTDATSGITGIGVINNVWVILEESGIHLGTATGVAPPVGPVFRFEKFTDVVGNWYAGLAAFTAEQCFFVGPDDVYMFDLRQITPIGQQIKDLLFTALSLSGHNVSSLGVLSGYYGFVTADRNPLVRTAANNPSPVKPRWRYHIAPAFNAISAQIGAAQTVSAVLPHFVYDVAEQKWSVLRYGTLPVGLVMPLDRLAIFDQSGNSGTNLYRWDEGVPCEDAASLTGPLGVIEDPEMDYHVSKTLIKYRNYGATEGISVTLTGERSDGTETSVTDNSQQFGTEPATERWKRQYCITDITGNLFQWRIDVPPGNKFAVNHVSLRYTEASEYKGMIPPWVAPTSQQG